MIHPIIVMKGLDMLCQQFEDETAELEELMADIFDDDDDGAPFGLPEDVYLELIGKDNE